jgi:iron(III) transport system permease protein
MTAAGGQGGAGATALADGPAKGTDWLPYVVAVLSAVVLVVFIVYPIGKTALSGFIKQGDALAFGNLTLANFESFLISPTYRDALFHSIAVAGWTTVFSVLLGVPAAYAVSRVRIPFRGLIITLSVIPLIAPPFIGAYAWVILLGRNGMLTPLLNMIPGVQWPGIYGPVGIVFVLSLHFFPYVFLFVQGALAAADPYIEESAVIMGATRARIMRTVTLPLVTPAIMAGVIITFAMALGNFGVPSILGGEYYVLPTLIFYQVNAFFNLNAASAIALVSVVLTMIVVLISSRIMKRRRFVTVTSTTRAAKRHVGLGARVVSNAYVWLLLGVAILPQAVVVFTSFAERWAGSFWPQRMGIGNYRTVFTGILDPIYNSIYLSAAATALCVVFGTLAAFASARKRFFGRSLLDLTIMLPFVLPGIVTGVAFLITFNTGWLVLTGTSAIIIMAYFIRRIAYTFRAVLAAIGQLDAKIEEASTICGAEWLYTMRRITVPLIAPGILAGGILVFATLVTDLNLTILIYSADWKTIAIEIFDHLNNNQPTLAATVGTFAIVFTVVLVFIASKLVGKSMADMFR